MVRIHGRDHYLGRYNSEASHEEYRRLIAGLWASPDRTTSSAAPSTTDADGPTINEILVAYWNQKVVVYFVKHSRPSSEQGNINQALEFVRKLYGSTPAREFGTPALILVRKAMIQAERCRSLINKDICRVRQMFRWAVNAGLVSATILEALKAVEVLPKNRSEARGAEPVRPVPLETVQATLAHLPPQVAAMVQLQLFTGARPGEIIAMRPGDVTTVEGGVWLYRPREHKAEHHGRERVIPLGPRVQEVLRPWLERGRDVFCFIPAEVVAAKNARTRKSATGSTRTKARLKLAPKRQAGQKYTKDSYRVAIQHAAKKASVMAWKPLQPRHSAATRIRAEPARVPLGHAQLSSTEIYAEILSAWPSASRRPSADLVCARNACPSSGAWGRGPGHDPQAGPSWEAGSGPSIDFLA